ncbi:30S ribosomal protein S13 [Candidatus Peregrinibacteria bacterium]|nr:30S ribosomal protein S13 [Candidatus Peregrinibacteria bacterium]
MLRISGVVLPGSKRIEIALTAIKGIGRSLSRRILRELTITLDTKADALTEASRRNARTKRGKKKTGLSGRTTLTKT